MQSIFSHINTRGRLALSRKRLRNDFGFGLIRLYLYPYGRLRSSRPLLHPPDSSGFRPVVRCVFFHPSLELGPKIETSCHCSFRARALRLHPHSGKRAFVSIATERQCSVQAYAKPNESQPPKHVPFGQSGVLVPGLDRKGEDKMHRILL